MIADILVKLKGKNKGKKLTKGFIDLVDTFHSRAIDYTGTYSRFFWEKSIVLGGVWSIVFLSSFCDFFVFVFCRVVFFFIF